MKKVVIIASALLFAAQSVQAGIISVYDNQADFIADTGAASLTGPIPDAGNQGNNVTLGDVTFDTTAYATSTDIFFGGPTWSTLIPGEEIAISGTENLDVAINLGSTVEAFGFVFHEPSATGGPTDGTNTPQFYDSMYTITLFNGAAVVDTHRFDPANDQLLFLGLVTDMGFDSVSIVEDLAGITYGGGIDISNDNEFFGEFYAAVDVPEPSSAVLLLLGLLALGAAQARRR